VHEKLPPARSEKKTQNSTILYNVVIISAKWTEWNCRIYTVLLAFPSVRPFVRTHI